MNLMSSFRSSPSYSAVVIHRERGAVRLVCSKDWGFMRGRRRRKRVTTEDDFVFFFSKQQRQQELWADLFAVISKYSSAEQS